MTIAAVRNDKGYPRAVCVCDECGREEVVPAAFERSRGGRGGNEDRVIHGQAVRKITSLGWAMVKNKLLCPGCDAKRRAKGARHLSLVQGFAVKGESEMIATKEPEQLPLREPTREQKRQIVDLLGEVYDVKGGRYKGAETDKTVADAIGTGVLFGWVARIREDMFGPDGGNGEMEAISRELADLKAVLAKEMEGAKRRVDSLDVLAQQIDRLSQRLQAVRNSVGPTGGSRG
jgi:hypothetical protein